MATPSINGTNVPDSMKSRGVYKFERQRGGIVNGEGKLIAAGPQRLTWSFSYMTLAELQWWTQTIMSDAISLTLTAAELWDDEKNAEAFTSGELWRPTPEKYTGGLFYNVTVEITNLLPIL